VGGCSLPGTEEGGRRQNRGGSELESGKKIGALFSWFGRLNYSTE
jgi:hypothetical protein